MRLFNVTGEIDNETVSKVVDFLIEADGEDVWILISSHGGDAEMGMAVADLLEAYPAKVTTISSGMVASSAVIIYLAGKDRFAFEHSSFYVHSPSFVDEAIDFNLHKYKEKEYKDFYGRFNSFFLKKTTMDKETLEDFFCHARIITVPEGIKFGMIKGIIKKLPKELFKKDEETKEEV